jgi:predicted ATPase
MFHSGDSIGPYTLLRTLGRGAFGEVWLAEKRSSLLTTKAALKLPLVAESEIDAVRQEAALWLQASGHPNIVPVMDAEVYDGQVVIASEFIAGGTLHDWMTQRAPPHTGKAPSLEEAVAMTNGILAGLDYLHRVGLTHRDLKPENVLLQDGIPRLTDFGLARVLKTEANTGTISGTPRYMAPETFSGSYSASSDLWAVGVILQELLTGTHPFPTQELMALIMAIEGQEPVSLPDSIPERLCSIVSRLLAKSPTDRFASASVVREALQNSVQPVHSLSVHQEDAPALPPHNLPVQPTSFIGRVKQITELKGLLSHTHLLSLTGSGGCGKTRLSLQVAEEVLEQFADGVWLVELAPLADPALVPNAVANVLGITEAPGETITKSVLSALKGKQLLLVLDNCEHVLDAVARLLDAVLRSCPKVALMVSSRESLGIAGESAFRIPSLALPDLNVPRTPDNLCQYEAVHLFIDRAVSAKAGFVVTNENASVLARVCHRLDGIPLAIELAAARVRSMTLEELGQRLDDRFRILTGGSRTALPRQQTLRAMIDWSFDLLAASQKALLVRLSVFLGGWTLEAAEKVCAGGEVEEWEVLDLLTALDDKNLVMAEERGVTTRYRLLETVRQYAREKLAYQEDAAIYRSQHRHYFLALAEEAKEKLNRPEQVLWLNILETEHDNLRQALTFCVEDAEGCETGLRLGAALQQFWSMRGYLSEGRERLTALLSPRKLSGREQTKARADALNGAGTLSWMQGDFASARSQYEASLEIRRKLGDRRGIARSLNNLGRVAYHQGDYDSARSQYEASLEITRELGDRRGIAWNLQSFASLNAAERKPEQAARLWGAAERLREEIGSPLPPDERERYDRDVITARQALGEEVFSAAWAEG